MRIVRAHEKSNNQETTENKHAHVSNSARTNSPLCVHKSGSTGLFHTSSCRKHFDFLKVNVQVTVAVDQGISRLCDLFYNLWNGNSNIRRMPTSMFTRRIPASRFTRRMPASRFIRQLTRWLCMPLFSLFCQSLPTSSCKYNSSDLRVVHANSPEPWILATLKQRVFPVCFRR